MARSTFARIVAKVAVGALAVVTPVALAPTAAQAAATDLFFSEYVEGTGVNKAIEIYNGTGAAVDLTAGGYRLELYSNGSPTVSQSIALTGVLADGDVLVAANGGANAAILAATDLTANAVANWNGDDSIALRKGGVSGTIVDAFGQIGTDPGTEWGTGLASTVDNTIRRKASVCAGDTDGSNAFDPSIEWDGYAVDTFDGLGSHVANCGDTPPVEEAPAVTVATPANAGSGSARVSPTVTFSEGVALDGAVTLECSVTGDVPVTVSGGPTTFTVDPTPRLTYGETCTLTVLAAGVSDLDSNDPPEAMVADFSSTFTVALSSACASAVTPIPAIQGTGATVALPGNHTVRGVVVGDYEGASPALRGFYLQDVGDGDPATSDGIFVFNGGNQDLVEVGDIVTVTGTAGENQGQSQISTNAAGISDCGTGSVDPTPVTLPMANPTDFEKFEGMHVETTQPLYVTEHFQLGRFGQVVVSSGGRLQQPTNVVAPGADALALQAENNLNRLIIDDDSQGQNPDPILFGRGGDPLSAENTLRGGDILTEAIGVMTYTWAGNAASGNAFRLRPVGALNASYDFEAANPRPEAPEEVGGDVRAAAMNLLNYFNTFDGLPDNVDNCTLGVGGNSTDCRGADTQAEFDRQWPKTVAAILAVDADVLGVNEIENDGYGSDSSLKHLVDKLNAETGESTYAYIDVDANTGETNALGTDAIKVGMLYKPATVTPIGQTAALNTTEFVGGGDTAPRSRPSLAQAFRVNATGGSFVADVNHLKSKGSACTVPDAGDGQGNCNASRTVSAQALATWLDTDPTGTGEQDVIILGDLNSYAMEDPIKALEAAGYTNLVSSYLGEDAYSYVFDGQWGYLDHALGSADLVDKDQVAGVAEFHINADEPAILDYNTDFKTPNLVESLYAPDMFRVSDHDPVIVGLTPNSPATVDAAFDDASVGCGAGSASLTVEFADRDADDTHDVTIAWGDGTTETVETASSPLTRTHTYAAAGQYTATVTVTDSHGHVTTTTADVAVEFTTSGVRPPFKNGTVTAKSGSTVPVKVELVDCDGSEPTGLAPTVTVTLGGTVVRTGTMVDGYGQWTYSLRTSGLAAGTYTVTITVPETGQTITATVRVRS
jgi:predicted extracellular nuclease